MVDLVTDRDLVLLRSVVSQLENTILLSVCQSCQISLYYPWNLSQPVLLICVDHVIKIELKFRHVKNFEPILLLMWSDVLLLSQERWFFVMVNMVTYLEIVIVF